MNPFRKSPSPLRPGDKGRWVCMQETWQQLDECVQKRENTVILGVEGSGKSTLLNMFFAPERCAEAAENHTLIFFADLSDTEDGKDLCRFLIRQLLKSARQYLPEEDYLVLEQTLAKAREEEETDKRQFILSCESLYGRGYTLLLVMDGFERFVSSPQIKQDQHDMLRSLLDKDIMRCVVATNYDLQQTSLPPDIQGSLYLQKFQEKITIRGFTPKEAENFIAQVLPAEDEVQLNEKRIKFLYNVTGGIPMLFEMGASHMYDLLRRDGRVNTGQFQTLLYDQAKHMMKGWFKHFTAEYDLTIRAAVASMPKQKAVQQIRISDTNNIASNAAARLGERGFWKPCGPNTYSFNSLVLQTFTQNSCPPDVPAPEEKPAQQELPKRNYNVFISYKRTDGEVKTKDCEIALALYEALSKVDGVVPFLDVKEIPGSKDNNFNRAILLALETAQAFVYVCTNAQYITESSYIGWESDNYIGELASGRKPRGSIYGVLDKVTKPLVDNIPMVLRSTVDLYEYSPEDIQRLVYKLRKQLFG